MSVANGAARSFWKPSVNTADLDNRLENAMRRAAGSAGFDIGRDRGGLRTLKETAAQAVDAGMRSGGPWFMRAGRGLLEAGWCNPGVGIDMKAVAGEFLREFYTEGTAAFQTARASLYGEAQTWLKSRGLDDDHCKTVLNAADAAFCAPDKELFTQEALPLVGRKISPLSLALLGAGAVGIGVVALVRSPHLGVIMGVLCGAVIYFFARNHLRARAEFLVVHLPRKLYQLLATELNTNIRRYAETVNAAAPGGAGPA